MNQAAADRGESGMALITVLLLVSLLSAMLGSYFLLTGNEMSITQSSMDGDRGYFVAEAGLNIRADAIRTEFLGYNRPVGTPPLLVPGQLPCQGTAAALGSGSFACQTLAFGVRDALTYVAEQPSNPTSLLIPPGEPFQNLNAQEYRYVVSSVTRGRSKRPEAILEMGLNSRLVPMFQFAAFYDKDLEILPGPDMTLAGPVHVNGDLYLSGNNTLTIEGQVTTTGDLYHGRKESPTCNSGGVDIFDHTSTPVSMPACLPGRFQVTDLAPWGGMVRSGVDVVSVPPPESFDPVAGKLYWDKADLRVMLDLNAAPPVVRVRNADGTDSGLGTCGSAGMTTSFHDLRESKDIQMLDVDVQALLECIASDATLMGGKLLDDSTEGGLVWYLGVEGPDADAINDYGVRLSNGAELAAVDPLAPEVRGLTVVTNQAIYIAGDYNSADKKPAAVIADSLNILSNAYIDGEHTLGINDSNREAADTTIHAAFLSGTDTTGDTSTIPEGTQDEGSYNGGLENYPRFHEKWTGKTLTYRGSFVSLNEPLRVDGAWGTGNVYVPPIRDWGYDTDFNDAANLPPLSPRFVYLRQESFARDFGL